MSKAVLKGLLIWLGFVVGGLLFFLLGAFLLVHLLNDDGPTGVREKAFCTSNLRHIGGELVMQKEEGNLQPLSGQAFILQVSDTVREEEWEVFCCPGDPDAPRVQERGKLHCSYRGPGADTARKFIEGKLEEPVIIACDANGPDGNEPFHEEGVVVLWSNGLVNFIPWEDMEGYDGGPVRVGPDSPDPRFRHLIR